MPNRIASWLVAVVAALAIALLVPAGGAQAADADVLKASGKVGERYDGYLGIVESGVGADVKKSVTEINAKRKAAYAEIARKNGTKVEAVAAITGKKLIDRAPAGQYVMLEEGVWVQK